MTDFVRAAECAAKAIQSAGRLAAMGAAAVLETLGGREPTDRAAALGPYENPEMFAPASEHPRDWSGFTGAPATSGPYRSAHQACSASVEPPPSPGVPGAEPAFDWVTWVIPAICEVLTMHWWYASRDGEAGCVCSYRDGVDMTHDQWRGHVAPLIATRIHLAARQQ